ncbi:hypothetical protein [Moorena sp. SIO3I8]|uniref:hypothetical protein n=1 Tax=Moorena sp. SIO3I8 TaxID=2607833 RepID=UPI0013C204C2|nr:hypothetical protein [Moorena sp. SIO3I8]NEO08433.1 hypothetical protein [Moorena sp. SIO3I8]
MTFLPQSKTGDFCSQSQEDMKPRSNKPALRVINTISVLTLLPSLIFWGCNAKSEWELLTAQHDETRHTKAKVSRIENDRAIADARAANHIVKPRLAVYIPGYIYSDRTRIRPSVDYSSNGTKRRLAKSKTREQYVLDDSDPHICIGVISARVFSGNDYQDIEKLKTAFLFKGSDNQMEADYASAACGNYNKSKK